MHRHLNENIDFLFLLILSMKKESRKYKKKSSNLKIVELKSCLHGEKIKQERTFLAFGKMRGES